MLDTERVDNEEDSIRADVERLPPELKRRYFQSYAKLVKDPDTYAVLNWFAFVGLHDFYLGNWAKGFVMLGTFLAGVALLLTGVWPLGLLLIIGAGLWELWELFRSQVIVRDYNNRVARTLLHDLNLEASRSTGAPPSPLG